MDVALRCCVPIVVFAAALAMGEAAAANEETPMPENRPRIIIERARELMLDRRPPDADAARELAAAVTEDGRWPDIDYRDNTGSAWRVAQHLARTRRLALAATHPESAARDDDAVRDAMWRALDHWLERRYQNPNWWHNRIGTPRQMRDVLVLLEPELTAERRAAGWEVVGQYGRVDMTGANLIWVADLALHRAAAADNEDLLRRTAARAAAEIKITTGEGIQPDFSFHQHGRRLQQFHYGGSYAHDLCRLAWLLRDTPWAFPDDRTAILADYIIEGMDWMRRGEYTVPGTLCRAASRRNALGGKNLAGHLRLLRDVIPERADEMDAIIDREAGRGEPLVGFRHFPRSDFTAYHRPQFSVFLKTVSSRTLFAEQINQENLRGRRMHSGNAYFMRDGREYYNLMPVWDWFWFPGITIAARLPDLSRRCFVGGAGDGQSGLVAMDYRFGDALTARKAWFFHGDRVVYLTGDLRAPDHPHPVFTSLDQSRLDGDVTLGIGGRRVVPEAGGTVRDVDWLHHRGVAYVLFQPGRIELNIGEVEGSWHTINRGYPDEPVTDRVFRPLLHHGERPDGLGSAHLLGPADTPDDAAELADRPGVEVLANGGDVQAVRFDDGTLMAAFFVPGAVRADGEELLRVDHPCLMMVRDGVAWVSDPEHREVTVAIRAFGGDRIEVNLPGDGTAARRELPR